MFAYFLSFDGSPIIIKLVHTSMTKRIHRELTKTPIKERPLLVIARSDDRLLNLTIAGKKTTWKILNFHVIEWIMFIFDSRKLPFRFEDVIC